MKNKNKMDIELEMRRAGNMADLESAWRQKI